MTVSEPAKFGFTLSTYSETLHAFHAEGYAVTSFQDYLRNPQQKHLVLRHDIDNSLQQAMRAALRTPGKPEAVVDAIVQVLDGFGIQPAEKVEPLPPIALDDVRLIAWMAVEGTKAESAPASGAAEQ